MSIIVLTFFLPSAAYSLVTSNEPFDSSRIPVELQAWWAPNYGHIHAGVRLPFGQSVSGTLNVDVRIVLHDNPSRVNLVRICAEGDCIYKKSISLECPYDGQTSTNCAFNVPFSLDTTKMKDGWRELRVTGNMETPDGKRFFNSSGIPVNVQNGGSASNYNRFCDNTSLIGRGWYEGFGYTNAIIECVPLEPVSGQKTFRVRAQKASGHLTVALDKTHFIPAAGPYPPQQHSNGQILFDKDGDFGSWQDINIDTTKLADGWHSLAATSTNPGGATSECEFCNGELNHAAGVAKMWFYVDNGGSAGNNPPAEEPPAEEPPAEEPPAEEPPAEEPPAEEPPAEEPPAEEPPAEEPPAEEPPAEEPPAEDPPAEDPPAEEPPVTGGGSVTYEEVQSGGSTNKNTVTTSASLGGAKKDLFLAAVSTRPNRAPVDKVSGLGLEWTRVEIQCSGRNATGIDVWMAQGTPSGRGKVTATFSSAPSSAAIVVSRYSNVDPEDPIGAIVSGNSNGVLGPCSDGSDNARYTLELPAPIDGSVIYGAASMRNRRHSPGSGFNERAEVQQGSGGVVTSVVVEDKVVPSSASSVMAVDGSFHRDVDWAVIGLELRPLR